MTFIILGSYFSVFGFFGADERKHAIVCITPHWVEKGVSINTIGRYCRVLSQFRMCIFRWNGFYYFGGLAFPTRSRFRFSFFSEPKNENMLKCVLPHIG